MMSRMSKRIKGNRRLGISIMLLAGMMLLSVILPGLVMAYEDRRISSRTTSFELQVEAYANHYSGVGEMMEAMARKSNWEGIQLVPITDSSRSVSDDELTGFVNQELEKLSEKKAFADYSEVFLKGGDLKERSLLSCYSEEPENALNGIRLWKLTYENQYGSINLLLEADFGKICVFQMITDGFTVRKDMESSTSSITGYNAYCFKKERIYNYYQNLTSRKTDVLLMDGKIAYEKTLAQNEQSSTDSSTKSKYDEESFPALRVYLEREYWNAADYVSDQFGIWPIYQMIQF